MRELKEILREGFYANIGSNNCIANAITLGQKKISMHGINPFEEIMPETTAEITKTSLISIHVKLKGFKLSKMEFDIDFTEYEDKLRELAKGRFLDLKFNWCVNDFSRDNDLFTMWFTNINTRQEYFLNYNVNSDTLTTM